MQWSDFNNVGLKTEVLSGFFQKLVWFISLSYQKSKIPNKQKKSITITTALIALHTSLDKQYILP